MKKLSPLLYTDFNPFDGINLDGIPADCKGWGSEDPFLEEIIETTRPQIILEMGTWKGASAIHMARASRRLHLENEIICADPHVGSPGLWLANKSAMHLAGNGECGTYELFLANVKRAGFTDIITPFRVTSSVATAVMQAADLKADVIYIDGSHDKIDVLSDLEHSLRVLHDNSLIVCDDFDHPRIKGVTEAVQEFLGRHAEFEVITSRLTDIQFYTEKIIGEEVSSKAVIAKPNSRFASHFRR